MFQFWLFTIAIEAAFLLYFGFKANDDRTADKEQYAVTFFIFLMIFLCFDAVAVCWQITSLLLHK